MRDTSYTRREFLQGVITATAGAAACSCGLHKAIVPAPCATSSTATEAAAWALADSGAHVVTTVPATGTVDIYDAWCRTSGHPAVYSYHEEAAYTIAHGAALAGARAVSIMKSHGCAKAANSVLDSLSCGTTAGCVLLVTNDRFGRHSDTAMDVAPMLRGIGMPYVNPPAHRLYEELRAAFLRSEELGLPVAVLTETEDFSERICLERRAAAAMPVQEYTRDVHRHVLCPILARYQHAVLQKKLRGGDWRSVLRPEMPSVPAGLPEKWHAHIMAYEPVFSEFKKVRALGDIVCGDTGVSSLFAFPPYDCIDICTYYGGSIPLAAGACLAGRKRVWAVSGDYAFVAAGHLGLIEAAQRRLPITIILLHNGIAATTGGQAIGADVFERLIAPYEPFVRRIHNPFDRREIGSVLAAAKRSDSLCIIVAEYLAAGQRQGAQ